MPQCNTLNGSKGSLCAARNVLPVSHKVQQTVAWRPPSLSFGCSPALFSPVLASGHDYSQVLIVSHRTNLKNPIFNLYNQPF